MSSISGFSQNIAIDESMKRLHIDMEHKEKMLEQDDADERQADRAASNVETAKSHNQSANQQPTPITNTAQSNTPNLTASRQSAEDGIGANFDEIV